MREECREELMKIGFGLPQYRQRYYQIKFGIDIDKQPHKLTEIITEYLSALCWIQAYYYAGVASWHWIYPYHFAPLLTDVAQQIGHIADNLRFKFEDEIERRQKKDQNKSHSSESDSSNNKEEHSGDDDDDDDDGQSKKICLSALMFRRNPKVLGRPVTPITQATLLLPPSSAEHALPQCLAKLVCNNREIREQYYPSQFRIVLNGKSRDWEGIALIPHIDVDTLCDYIQRTKDDCLMNNHSSDSSSSFVFSSLTDAQSFRERDVCGKHLVYFNKNHCNRKEISEWTQCHWGFKVHKADKRHKKTLLENGCDVKLCGIGSFEMKECYLFAYQPRTMAPRCKWVDLDGGITNNKSANIHGHSVCSDVHCSSFINDGSKQECSNWESCSQWFQSSTLSDHDYKVREYVSSYVAGSFQQGFSLPRWLQKPGGIEQAMKRGYKPRAHYHNSDGRNHRPYRRSPNKRYGDPMSDIRGQRRRMMRECLMDVSQNKDDGNGDSSVISKVAGMLSHVGSDRNKRKEQKDTSMRKRKEKVKKKQSSGLDLLMSSVVSDSLQTALDAASAAAAQKASSSSSASSSTKSTSVSHSSTSELSKKKEVRVVKTTFNRSLKKKKKKKKSHKKSKRQLSEMQETDSEQHTPQSRERSLNKKQKKRSKQ